MNKKILVVSKPKQCIGCQICVLASARISKNILSISDAFISVFSKGKDGFDISIDRAQKNNYEELVKICPRKCFSITTNEP
jgi:NAD-dependent dihydropyrimidine dehydrogenase PreA subunit